MYFNINVVNFLKDLREIFPKDVLKSDTVFYVDEKDVDVVTVTDPKNSKERNYLRLYLYEDDDSPVKGHQYNENTSTHLVTYDTIDKFTGDSQCFLSQGAIVYISENFLNQLKANSVEDDKFTQYSSEVYSALVNEIRTVDDVIDYLEQVKIENTIESLSKISLHVDRYLIEDKTAFQCDFYLDLFDILVKSVRTRTEANDIIRFILDTNDSLKSILVSHGVMEWNNTIFIKISMMNKDGLKFQPSQLFDVYEPGKILTDVLSHHENFNEDEHGEISDVHVFKFTEPLIYPDIFPWGGVTEIRLFTTNPYFHQNELSHRIEEVLKAIDVESGLQGKPQSCYNYFKEMEKECTVEKNNLILNPNNVGYSKYTGSYDTIIDNGDKIHSIGYGLYMKLEPNE